MCSNSALTSRFPSRKTGDAAREGKVCALTNSLSTILTHFSHDFVFQCIQCILLKPAETGPVMPLLKATARENGVTHFTSQDKEPLYAYWQTNAHLFSPHSTLIKLLTRIPHVTTGVSVEGSSLRRLGMKANSLPPSVTVSYSFFPFSFSSFFTQCPFFCKVTEQTRRIACPSPVSLRFSRKDDYSHVRKHQKDL